MVYVLSSLFVVSLNHGARAAMMILPAATERERAAAGTDLGAEQDPAPLRYGARALCSEPRR